MWALKILHEKNWRVSLCVQELYHPPNFLRILAATPGFQNLTMLDLSRQTTGFPVLSWSPFYLVLNFWLAWATTGNGVLFVQHVNLTQVLDGNLSHTGLPVL